MSDLEEIIPENVLKSGSFFGIPYINWTEAILVTTSFCIMIYSTNFVMKIKAIICIVVGIAFFVLFLRGIQNKSIFQFLLNVIITQRTKAEYHLGSVADDRRETNQDYFGRESFAEKGLRKTKKAFRDFDQKYGK